MAHGQFDKLAGIGPAKRSREDRLPASLLTTIEKWLGDSGADDLAKWSHAYLAHAGGPESRKRIAELRVTASKITDSIKALARVTEAISAWLLFSSGRTNALMPVAQFNPFENLDRPIMQAGGEATAYTLWHQRAKPLPRRGGRRADWAREVDQHIRRLIFQNAGGGFDFIPPAECSERVDLGR
jgi:hypothetical protein